MTPSVLNPRRSPLPPRPIHAARRDARRTLVCLRTLRPALGDTAFAALDRSMRDFIDISAPSRDAEVQWQMVRRLTAGLPKRRARQCRELLRELTARKAMAHVQLTAALQRGDAVRPRQPQALRQLQQAQCAVDLPRLAARRYRHTLRSLDEQLAKPIPRGRRVHRLRIRLRRARDLATLFDAPPRVGAKHLLRRLDWMQEALGELHDCLLLNQWATQRDIAIPPPLRRALDARAQRWLQRLRRRRKPLRQALHRFLKKMPH